MFHRLVINYKENVGGKEKLEDIYNKSCLQFSKVFVVPSKEVLSKVIQKLFHIKSVLNNYKGKSKYTVFN